MELGFERAYRHQASDTTRFDDLPLCFDLFIFFDLDVIAVEDS
jgi:hypothetical protein